MKLWQLTILALGALLAATAGAAKPLKTYDLWLNADITIDQHGRMASLDWKNAQPGRQLIAERLTQRVQAWEFVPAMVDGQRMETRTGLIIGIHVTEHPDGSVALQITDAHTGPRPVSTVPPRYPVDAVSAGVSGLVVVDLQVEPDGKPVILDMRFEGSSGKRSYRESFTTATKSAVTAWTFQPEVVAGRAVRTRMQVPVDFCLEPSTWCAKQKSLKRIPDRPANIPVALDSAVTFKTDFRAAAIP
jgi:TonB family protein